MPPLPLTIGQPPDRQQVWRVEQTNALLQGKAISSFQLFCNVSETSDTGEHGDWYW